MEKALMSTKALAEYLDMSVTELRRIKNRYEDFPKPVILSNSKSVQCKNYWLRSAVDCWVEKLAKNNK